MSQEDELGRMREELGRLREELRRLRRRVEELESENAALRERVRELERASARQAAPFRREERLKVAPQERKRPGRKAGHPGCCRAMPQEIDEVVEVPLEGCPRCGGAVEEIRRVEQVIEEIPPMRPQVVKVVTYEGVCRRCGEVRTLHPLQTSLAEGAAKVQLGPRALALAASLNKSLGLTMRKTCRVLKELAGLRVSPGGLSQALCRVARRVRGVYDGLIERIRASPAVFADETSWWVGTPGWWLWVFTTPEETLYRVEESRGSAVVEEVLGKDFAGMLVSDCLSSYDPPGYAKHKCIAHHLRAIAEAEQMQPSPSSYLHDWRLFFATVRALYRARRAMGEKKFLEARSRTESWRDRLLDRTVEQPGELAVRNRLAKQRAHLLGCLYEPAAEPTNNRAERALRPAVIARKLSCGNKTVAGRDCWQVLASLSATCRQRSRNFTDYLAPLLPLTAPTG